MKALARLTAKELLTRRWTSEKPETADFYYDEPLADITKRISKLPTYNLDHSDACATAIS